MYIEHGLLQLVIMSGKKPGGEDNFVACSPSNSRWWEHIRLHPTVAQNLLDIPKINTQFVLQHP